MYQNVPEKVSQLEHFVDYTPPKREEPPLKDNYLEKFRADNKDLSRFLPFVTINKFSFSGNEFLYGWTYRTSAVINIRDDLQGEKRTEVEIHEAIHTSDEYETRRITEWIMQSLPKMEDKYLTKPPRYQI